MPVAGPESRGVLLLVNRKRVQRPYDFTEILRVELLANGGKTCDITEQHRYLATLALNVRMLARSRRQFMQGISVNLLVFDIDNVNSLRLLVKHVSTAEGSRTRGSLQRSGAMVEER